jgi:hypothetical protein
MKYAALGRRSEITTTYAAKVRNDFVLRLLPEICRRLKGLEVAACPFFNLPEKKRTKFVGLRDDKNPAEIVREQ